nr:MAG TPA: hypothetical protein [Caudoviricetes sp.]
MNRQERHGKWVVHNPALAGSMLTFSRGTCGESSSG